MTKFLATLSGRYTDEQAALGRYAGDGPGGADSPKYSATNFFNIFKGIFRKGPSASIHFASNARIEKEKGRFEGDIWVNSITTETMDRSYVTVDACVGSDCDSWRSCLR
jgi:hypothetical protein